MDSIIPGDSEERCHYCGRYCNPHKHHIFGAANRKWSEKFGLFVHLCPEHHNMSDQGIHFNKKMMDEYHQLGQMAFEVEHSREEFMKIFGRNYL